MTTKDTAAEVLRYALSRGPDWKLTSVVTAEDLVRLVAPLILQCPSCGSEAWVNLDCDLCTVVHEIGTREVEV